MSQETRQRANRATVVQLLGRASQEAAKAVLDAQRAVEYIRKAQALVAQADELAQKRPGEFGQVLRPLPAGIRRKTLRAVTMLEALARDVAEMPVTRDERVLAKRKRQEAKTA